MPVSELERQAAAAVSVPPADAPAFLAGRRIAALDGLRGLAILLVVLGHAAANYRSSSLVVNVFLVVGRAGWSGVDLFFVLSGFLIGGILIDAKASPRYFSTFYARRAYRILPLYFALVVVAYAVTNAGWESALLGTPQPVPFWGYATFSQNLWMARFGLTSSVALSVTWSLAVEEQFYLTVPLLVRKLGRSSLVGFLGAVVLAAPLLRILAAAKLSSVADYVLTPCRADALCLGVLAAVVVREKRLWRWVTRHPSALYLTALVPLSGIAWMAHAGSLFGSAHTGTLGYSFLALFYTCCLLVAVAGVPAAVNVLSWRWLVRLGQVSYCLYLVHLPLMTMARSLVAALVAAHGIQVTGGTTGYAGAILGVGLSLLVAEASWRLFERPMLRRGHAYTY